MTLSGFSKLVRNTSRSFCGLLSYDLIPTTCRPPPKQLSRRKQSSGNLVKSNFEISASLLSASLVELRANFLVREISIGSELKKRESNIGSRESSSAIIL